MKLIIVESPTKAKTISRFLGKEYKVESSFGHVRDLPVKEMGVDIEGGFLPSYVVPAKAKKVISRLKAAAQKSSETILASDEDREGEAIAWHLIQALKLKEEETKRIAFHEITKEAIIAALDQPRQLDYNMVDAQQARRVLDRLVGYELSPFLWKKVARGLSAGRVQSVATRLIVEREGEIKAFEIQEYWSLAAELEAASGRFLAELYKINGKTFDKLDIKEKEAKRLETELKSASFSVLAINRRELNKSPNPPFTTSTLQQSANRLLGFSAKQTMTVAQKLYEEGYITYMRTDSLNLSPKFLNDAKNYLQDKLGQEYLPEKPRIYKSRSKNAQEAHEAIRPTEASLEPDSLADKIDRNQLKLYRLIWQRALASQMASARLAATSIDVETKEEKKNCIFRATGQTIIFPGYLKVWPEKTKDQDLPPVLEKESLKLISLIAEAHQTNPPARYSDAGLVKELEKHGIGRPSTYAPTIATIIARNYVERDEGKRLKPTDIAFVVTDLLVKHFPKIADYQFTAKLENDLDEIAAGRQKWQPVIADFYDDFHGNLEKKYQELTKKEIMPEEQSKETCDKCGAPMVIKTGRFGKFLACSAFPECKNIKRLKKDSPADQEKDEHLKSLEEKYAEETCDKCGAPMKVRTGRYGPFLACSAFPKCKNIKNISSGGQKEEAISCPVCQKGHIVKKFSRRGAFYACDNYPDCKNAYWGKPTGQKCPDCGALLLEGKSGKIGCSDKDCGYKE